MNFGEFQELRTTLLRDRPEVIDCGATNLYGALARLIPPPLPPSEQRTHRSHLAAEWVRRFGLPTEVARRAFVSCGVRDSLALLFTRYAADRALLWLPSDNYPVYAAIARAAGLAPREYPTLPEPLWPFNPPSSNHEVLLLTNPLKPRGRWIDQADVDCLTAWLSASARRRVLIDAVYTFETSFHATTVDLFRTEQVILLHSLTKGWLQPRLFGIALVPEQDTGVLAPSFKQHAVPQHSLARAREMLGSHAALPALIAQELRNARERLHAMLPSGVATIEPLNATGYFTPVRCGLELLESRRLLGIPASAFGSRQEDITVLSSLSFISPDS